MRHWLFKSEPGTYSWEDLVRDGRTEWEGVRNYQARNLMRDEMAVGDLVLFYHSRVQPMVIPGVARIARAAYPDHHALDPASPYHDPRATPDDPVWVMVDVEPVAALDPPVTRADLKAHAALADMMVLRRGARLSVQPVTPAEFDAVLAMRNLDLA